VIVNLTTDIFDQFIATANRPVLVDYWADWCQPCKMMLPILESIAEEYKETIIVAKVNVDQNEELALGLVSIPTIKVFVGPLEVLKIVGAKNKQALLLELADWL
jgi:thioredoxin